MTSPLRGSTARAIGLATAIIAVAALLLGLMASALGGESSAADDAVPPAAVGGSGAPPPAAAPPSAAPPSGATQNAAGRSPSRYVVAEGDTLAAIADRSGVPTELIAQDSGLTDPDRLAVGQVLTLSTPPRNVVVVVSGSTLTDYAQQVSTSVGELLALNPQIRDPDVINAGSGLRVSAG